MINHDPSMPSNKPARRIEKELNLTDDHERKIIDTLVDTVDELRIFSEPFYVQRIANSIPISQSESQLPSRYQLLNMHQVLPSKGTYKTKLTSPGRTLTLEGTRQNECGMWRIESGGEEQTPLEHTDVVKYLQTILSSHPNIDKLNDMANISDQTMNEALWNDLASLTSDWQEGSYYRVAQDLYAPSLTKDIQPRDGHPKTTFDADYFSSVEWVLSHEQTPTSTKYKCRLGTQLPVDLSDPTTSADSMKPADVHSEHKFSVEYLNQDTRIRTALASYALESDYLTSRRLKELADNTTLRLDDVPSIYTHATDLVKKQYLNMDDFLSE